MTVISLITLLTILIYFRHCQADTSLCETSSNCSNQTEQSFIQLLLKESYYIIAEDSLVWTIWSWLEQYQAWILSIIGSSVVGLSGIFPLLVIPIEEGANLKTGAAASTLRVLLSFAVGGLLGDVFLHLLPEAWASERPSNSSVPGTRGSRHSMSAGLWVLAGILLFTVLEMACPDHKEEEEEETEEKTSIDSHVNNNTLSKETSATNMPSTYNVNSKTNHNISNGSKINLNGSSSHSEHSNGGAKYTNDNINIVSNTKSYSNYPNGIVSHNNDSTKFRKNGSTKSNGHSKHAVEGSVTNGITSNRKESNGSSNSNIIADKPPVKQVAGYLNLLANSIDNFMHGLAVGGGFLVSVKMGALTTLAILIHEIPHEIGDFAILLRAGFSRWDAARAQIYTAGSGVLGALTAVACSSSDVESRTSWVVPFTAGGFLHIALVTVLPELLAERDKWESAKQLVGLLTGMFVMAVLTTCFE